MKTEYCIVLYINLKVKEIVRFAGTPPLCVSTMGLREVGGEEHPLRQVKTKKLSLRGNVQKVFMGGMSIVQKKLLNIPVVISIY